MPLGWPTPVVWPSWSLALAKPAGHTLSSINIFHTWPLYTDSYQIFHCVWMKGCSSAVVLKLLWSLDISLVAFLEKKVTRRVWKVTKSSNKVAKFATLRASLLLTSLSVWLQQHTDIFKRTHTYRNIWTTANQRGVRPSLSLIDLDHDMGLICVCCWTPGRLSESQRLFFSLIAGRTGATADFFFVAPLRN